MDIVQKILMEFSRIQPCSKPKNFTFTLGIPNSPFLPSFIFEPSFLLHFLMTLTSSILILSTFLTACRRDATLREISSLIKSVRPEARPRDVKISFSSVYPDKRSGRFLIRELGKVHSSAKGIDDQKTLDEVRFEIGDFLDVSISK
jgi:hypothetical protein